MLHASRNDPCAELITETLSEPANSTTESHEYPRLLTYLSLNTVCERELKFNDIDSNS